MHITLHLHEQILIFKTMKCPNCNSTIFSKNINVQTDVAKCSACKIIFNVSEQTSSSDFDPQKMPSGSWLIEKNGKVILGATTQSTQSLIQVPITFFWTVVMFGGIYGSQFLNNRFDLLRSLFGIPFIIITIFLWGMALMTIDGKVELTLSELGGKVFTGVGSLGITETFFWDEISNVEEQVCEYKYPNSMGSEIIMTGLKKIKFGSVLTNERKHHLFRSLKMMFNEVKSNSKSHIPEYKLI